MCVLQASAGQGPDAVVFSGAAEEPAAGSTRSSLLNGQGEQHCEATCSLQAMTAAATAAAAAGATRSQSGRQAGGSPWAACCSAQQGMQECSSMHKAGQQQPGVPCSQCGGQHSHSTGGSCAAQLAPSICAPQLLEAVVCHASSRSMQVFGQQCTQTCNKEGSNDPQTARCCSV